MAVYAVRSKELVKIGFTDDLRRRIRTIASSIPSAPVEFIGYMPGGREVEAHLHSVFKNSRFSGEWFVETPEMTTLLELLLIKKLPERKTSKAIKRSQEVEAMIEVADRLQAECARRWPTLKVLDRVDEMATELGWNKSRARDVYYGDKRVAIRSFEQSELDAFLATENRLATT